jgi:hypothetical protein
MSIRSLLYFIAQSFTIFTALAGMSPSIISSVWTLKTPLNSP